MKYLATGWACNLNDLFVRFPYEKCKSLIQKTKNLKRQKVKQVFREGVNIILEDIVENNVSFKAQGIGSQRGEIHFEPITGSEFERVYAKGKFKGVDFLESFFTGYQLYLYTYNKNQSLAHKKKIPIYFGGFLKEKLVQNINEGKTYC